MPLTDGTRCPKCRSTLFHVKQIGSEVELTCWKKDWSMKLTEKKE